MRCAALLGTYVCNATWRMSVKYTSAWYNGNIARVVGPTWRNKTLAECRTTSFVVTSRIVSFPVRRIGRHELNHRHSSANVTILGISRRKLELHICVNHFVLEILARYLLYYLQAAPMPSIILSATKCAVNIEHKINASRKALWSRSNGYTQVLYFV